MLLFKIAEAQITQGLDRTLITDQMKLIGLLFCTVVPVSIMIGWLFLRMWVLIAKQGMTNNEIRKFIERGLGIKT